MDRMLYIGMSAAKETMLAQGLNTHNLANVSTAGFRADLEQARSMPVFGPGYPTRAFAMTERPGINFTPGPLERTGRDLDMAIKGDGWFAIESKDGSEAYTRAGDIHITATGALVTGEGFPIKGNAGPIVLPPAEEVTVGVDGTITIKPIGQGADALVVIDRIKTVKPDLADLEKSVDGLFRMRDGSEAPFDPSVTLLNGTLEKSNVSVVDAMVKMIELQRHYELVVKSMKTAEENDQSTDALIRMS